MRAWLRDSTRQSKMALFWAGLTRATDRPTFTGSWTEMCRSWKGQELVRHEKMARGICCMVIVYSSTVCASVFDLSFFLSLRTTCFITFVAPGISQTTLVGYHLHCPLGLSIFWNINAMWTITSNHYETCAGHNPQIFEEVWSLGMVVWHNRFPSYYFHFR